MKKFLTIVGFLAVTACGAHDPSKVSSDNPSIQLKAQPTLSGKSYCRSNGSLGGGQVETCLNFDDNNSGVERDTSSGIPRNDEFYYYVYGNKVTIVISESRVSSYVREMELSADGSTLSYQEGTSLFVWTKR